MSLDNLTFRDFIPEHTYRTYFDTMMHDEILYMCVVQNEDQSAHIYLEKPSKNEEKIDGVIRVFFSKDEFMRYCRQVAVVEGIQPELVKRWEMKFTSAVEYISTFDQRNRAAGGGGVRAVACSILKEKFIDIDVFWTSESNFMV